MVRNLERSFILISCEIGTENNLFSELRKIEEIKQVTITYGDYDIVAEAETSSAEKMDELISTKIRRIKKIRSTITLRAMP